MNLVVFNKYNIPHLLTPLDNKVLKDKYRGKVIFVTIHRLSNPNVVSDIYNNNKNYLTMLKESTKFKKNINNKYDEFTKVVTFAEKCWDETDYLSSDYRCNSIKIITVFAIDDSKLLPGNEESFTTLVVPNKNLLITRDTMFAYQENPSIHNDVDLSQFKNDIIPGTDFMYIIDNDDLLAERYFNQFGETKKVPKFKSKQQQISGLYVVTIQENFTLKVDKFYKIEDIDTCDFIYRTQEEADQGADKTALFAQQIREKELTMQHTIVQAREKEAGMQQNLLQTKEKYELTVLELKKENERIKSESERLSKENDIKFTELKREIERVGMTDKVHYERNHYGMKNDFERESYRRDSSLETLKTVGGICGVLATGVMIYGKLHK
jgi:hypothetical protein